MTDKEKIEQLVDAEQYMILAVTLDDGTPWVVPVKLQAHDSYRTLEWDSRLDTVHSQALAARPSAAVTIFRKEADKQTGFYATGTAELAETRGEYGRYRFTAAEAWINDETFVKRTVELN